MAKPRSLVCFVRPGARDYAIAQAPEEGWTLDDDSAVNPPDTPQPRRWHNRSQGNESAPPPVAAHLAGLMVMAKVSVN